MRVLPAPSAGPLDGQPVDGAEAGVVAWIATPTLTGLYGVAEEEPHRGRHRRIARDEGSGVPVQFALR